ncbi:MAG: hypothetical protein NTV23_09075 [Propionibacteriales bacterium]|nr:hypothetical protein [Propionibacteriales bacterium]
MPPLTRPVAVLLGVLLGVLAAGCGGGADGVDGAGKDGRSVALAPGTCWTAETLGADPQVILGLSQTYGVDYFSVAHAVDGRPAFKLTEACSKPHHLEVYKVVPVATVTPVVTGYDALLRYSGPEYRTLSRAVERACMNESLAAAAQRSGIPGAVVEPAFPEGVELGWAPPSPAQWDSGQRVYACTLASQQPVQFRYAGVFTRGFPTGARTCISNSPLLFVDCARKHDRERIAVIDVRAAVAARKFPGRSAIKVGSRGRFVQVPTATLAALDRTCTEFLASISTTDRLTGVAEIDAERWPEPDGTYPVDCEADAPPTKESVTTEGSVFNR